MDGGEGATLGPFTSCSESWTRSWGFGFPHFNDGECRCLIEGLHTSRDGVEIYPEHVRLLLEGSIARLTTSSDLRIRERFLIGRPCPRCHGVHAEDVLRKFSGLKHYHRLPAMLFHHAIRWSRPRLATTLAKRGTTPFSYAVPNMMSTLSSVCSESRPERR